MLPAASYTAYTPVASGYCVISPFSITGTSCASCSVAFAGGSGARRMLVANGVRAAAVKGRGAALLRVLHAAGVLLPRSIVNELNALWIQAIRGTPAELLGREMTLEESCKA